MKLSESFLQNSFGGAISKGFRFSYVRVQKRGAKLRQKNFLMKNAWVSGYKSLAKYLHCSVPTVCRLVKSGKIDPAIRKIGATYWFDKK